MDLENIFSIARTIALNGGRLYLVGGAVRDDERVPTPIHGGAIEK